MYDSRMEYDEDKVDEMVLALLFLTLHDGYRAWKGHDWGAMDRLHKKGMIGDPVGKAKSVALTEEGAATFARAVHQAFREIRLRATSSNETELSHRWRERALLQSNVEVIES